MRRCPEAIGLLDDVPVPVAVVGGDGRILAVNAAGADRYGVLVGEPSACLGEDLPRGPLHDGDGRVVGSLVVCTPGADQAGERLARLLAVTSRLGAARSVEDVAVAVCDHGAAGAGACAVALLRVDDEGEELEVVRRLGLDDDALARASGAVGRRGVLVEDGIACVPLHDEDRPLGVLLLRFRDPSGPDDATRRFLLAVGAQAAQALDRIRVEEAERGARRRQELLARASGVLAGSLDHEAAAAAVGRLVVQDFADSFSVHLHDGGLLRGSVVVNADAEREELMAAALPTPAGAAIERYLDELIGPGRSVLAPVLAPQEWAALVGDEADGLMRAIDVASAVVVGIHARGRRLGVLAVTRTAEREPFDQDAFLLVAELASRLAAAADAALAHRARAEQARTLQASLLPPRLPSIPGVALAARYDPVGDGSLVGGDFYDAFPLGDDRWCLVLGDVCGQGVAAASFTSLVRYTLRAAARMWRSPAQLLRFTNDAILDDGNGERFCTALVAVLRPVDGGVQVTLAAGGHHLPLVARADGSPPRPIGREGTALGIVRHPDLWDTTFTLGVGDVLVLTTDGVIEARDDRSRQVRDGFLEELVEANASAGAEALATAVERAVLAVGRGRAVDDVALLVVEVLGDAAGRAASPAPNDGPFDRRYPTDPASVTEARGALAGWLQASGITGPRVPDLLLALTETATNAVRAARTAIEVRAWLTEDAVMLEVTDDGPGFDPSVPRDSRELDPLAERGRGLFLVAAVVDECTIESGPNGSIVRCYVSR